MLSEIKQQNSQILHRGNNIYIRIFLYSFFLQMLQKI